jgi:hypothetical protein
MYFDQMQLRNQTSLTQTADSYFVQKKNEQDAMELWLELSPKNFQIPKK